MSKVKKTTPKSKHEAFKEQEPPLTAVIIAEELAERFEPLVQWTPICLLPLATVPLLHISLSRLIHDGFHNIIIYACRYAQKIQKFIDSNCYTKRFSHVKITVFNGNGGRCFGEVMRDIECNQLLRGVEEFVCLPADLVSDISLVALLHNFKERRKISSVSAIDLVCATLPPFISPTDPPCTIIHTIPDMKIIQVNRQTREMPVIFSSDAVLAAAKECKSISIRSDLLVTRVFICSSHIPPLFQDNFDYDSIDDLVNGIITNEDIMGYSVNVQFAPPSQLILPAAPCLKYLLCITPHFLSRLGSTHVHPPNYLITEPFSRLMEGVECTVATTGPVAIAPTCFASRSARIDPEARFIGGCLIGENCRIECGVVLTNTVLGDNCTVGENSHLTGVVALSNVHIGAEVHIDNSWLCSGVCIHDYVNLGPFCFVGFPRECATKEGRLHPGRLCINVEPELNNLPESIIVASEDDEERGWTVVKRLEVAPNKISFVDDEGDEDIDDSDAGSIFCKEFMLWRMNWGRHSSNFSRLDDSESIRPRIHSSGTLNTDPDNEAVIGGAGSNQAESVGGGASVGGEVEDADDEFLIQELQKTLSRSLELKQSLDIVTLEVNSLKHAYNISLEDLSFLLVKAIIALSSSEAKAGSQTALVKAFRKYIENFTPVLEKYVSKSAQCAAYCLQAVEDQACYQSLVMEAAGWLIHGLYNSDLVSEEVIREWVKSSPLLLDDELAPGCLQLRKNIVPFMNWLDEDAEEEEDEEAN